MPPGAEVSSEHREQEEVGRGGKNWRWRKRNTWRMASSQSSIPLEGDIGKVAHAGPGEAMH